MSQEQSGRIAIVNGGVGFWRCALLGYSAVDAHGEREFYWMFATSIGSPQRLRPYDCLVKSVVVLPMLLT